jgi:hypothetical protein
MSSTHSDGAIAISVQLWKCLLLVMMIGTADLLTYEVGSSMGCLSWAASSVPWTVVSMVRAVVTAPVGENFVFLYNVACGGALMVVHRFIRTAGIFFAANFVSYAEIHDFSSDLASVHRELLIILIVRLCYCTTLFIMTVLVGFAALGVLFHTMQSHAQDLLLSKADEEHGKEAAYWLEVERQSRARDDAARQARSNDRRLRKTCKKKEAHLAKQVLFLQQQLERMERKAQEPMPAAKSQPIATQPKKAKRIVKRNALTKKEIEAARVKELIEHRQAMRSKGFRVLKPLCSRNAHMCTALAPTEHLCSES